jgi:hypothetical protein
MDSVEQNDGPEALGWLRQVPPPTCFVWNKCEMEVAWAISFVEGLYALGSPRVVIPRWSIKQVAARPGRPGGFVTLAVLAALPLFGVFAAAVHLLRLLVEGKAGVELGDALIGIAGLCQLLATCLLFRHLLAAETRVYIWKKTT